MNRLAIQCCILPTSTVSDSIGLSSLSYCWLCICIQSTLQPIHSWSYTLLSHHSQPPDPLHGHCPQVLVHFPWTMSPLWQSEWYWILWYQGEEYLLYDHSTCEKEEDPRRRTYRESQGKEEFVYLLQSHTLQHKDSMALHCHLVSHSGRCHLQHHQFCAGTLQSLVLL